MTETTHPDELLAAYVDGSLSDSERDAVRSHLAACEACAADVALAARARDALSRMPDEAPAPDAGIVESVLRQLPAEPGTPRRALASASGSRRRERFAAWAPGLAAAAAAAALVVFGVLATHTKAPPRPAAASAPRLGAIQPGGQVVDRHAQYTPSSLTALASQLAADVAHGSRPQGRGSMAAEPAASGAAAPSEESPSAPLAGFSPAGAAVGVLDCLRHGSGVSGTPIYLERATFQGSAIYVGAILTPATGSSPAHLVVVAVSTGACQPVFFSTRSL